MEVSIDEQLIYAIVHFLSGCLTLLIALLTYRRRHATGGKPFFLFMITVTFWNWLSALSWIADSQFWIILWQEVSIWGMVSAPVLLFVFTVEFTNRSFWLSKKLSILLGITPISMLIYIWTDPVYATGFGYHFENYIPDREMINPWFWINNTYSLFLIMISFSIFIQSGMKQKAAIYKRQINISLIGFFGLIVYYIMCITNDDPFWGFNSLSIVYTLSGLFFAFSVLGFRMFDVNPVAFDILIDQMKDGLVVLDTKSRIIEINRVAAELTDSDPAHFIGTDLANFLHMIPGFSIEANQDSPSSQEIVLKGPPEQVMELTVNPIQNQNGYWLGDLLVWHDITYLKNVEKDLQLANEKIRDQAIRDALTGLHNRHYLNEILPKEIARAERLEILLAFLMIDIDHFKSINDTYGHEGGDAVLISIASYLEKAVRKGDIVIRYGGEEFLLILIDSNEENAYQRAEEIRQGIEKLPIPFTHDDITVTISSGLAIFPTHGFEALDVIRTADQALYQAKNSGRNRVCRAE